jgi:integrase
MAYTTVSIFIVLTENSRRHTVPAAYAGKARADDLEASTHTVNEKEEMGFTVMDHKSREIPISDDLVEALKMYKVLYPNRRTIFINRDGGGGGHFVRIAVLPFCSCEIKYILRHWRPRRVRRI